MNQYIKGVALCAVVIIISVAACCFIVDGYSFGDCTEIYHSHVLILKGIITSSAIIACSISLAIILKK